MRCTDRVEDQCEIPRREAVGALDLEPRCSTQRSEPLLGAFMPAGGQREHQGVRERCHVVGGSRVRLAVDHDHPRWRCVGRLGAGRLGGPMQERGGSSVTQSCRTVTSREVS